MLLLVAISWMAAMCHSWALAMQSRDSLIAQLMFFCYLLADILYIWKFYIITHGGSVFPLFLKKKEIRMFTGISYLLRVKLHFVRAVLTSEQDFSSYE